jgi:hypothetical protein
MPSSQQGSPSGPARIVFFLASIVAAACARSGRAVVEPEPLAGTQGVTLWVSNDFSSAADLFLVRHGARVLLQTLLAGSENRVTVPPEHIGFPVRIVVRPLLPGPSQMSREMTLVPSVDLEMRVSATKMCVHPRAGRVACP